MTSYPHHTNGAGGTVAWLRKLQGKVVGELIYCIASQRLVTILYYYSKHELWLLWGEKVVIREI